MFNEEAFKNLELKLESFLKPIIEDMEKYKGLNYTTVHKKWFEYQNEIDSKKDELILEVLELNGIDLNNIPESKHPTASILLHLSKTKINELFRKIYNEKIGPIFYLTQTP
jgi:hypothetical protein